MQRKNINPNVKANATLYVRYGKRIFDVLISIFILIPLVPVFILIGVLISLDSSGPIVFKQSRMGLYGKPFEIYKFRTMIKDADILGPSSTRDRDIRITKIGEVLRKLSLDELPQLVNVIKGDMSLVGFRPGVEKDYTNEDFESEIFQVKPGITGYAQVNGRSRLSLDEKRNWEKKYVRDISFAKDLIIIIKTIIIVINKNDSN